MMYDEGDTSNGQTEQLFFENFEDDLPAILKILSVSSQAEEFHVEKKA